MEHPTRNRIDQLTTQMKYRLGEGFTKAFYKIGVQDDGRVDGINNDEMK